ncbi:hypothetical protein [Sphingobacterium sp.]|uniref:hypothetical protein n=1 Tax=Sphingobacterium sp. TaxID=341027 RepID=UPI00258ADBA9|nr:hypothetical protein [Sphingobacterium sp.]WET69723.1 MAG: hypothetical protein P0Y57_01280 [Sphingobacterium sp.]
MGPRKLKVDGGTSYIFHINEITYHFNISLKQPLFEKGLIKLDGVLDIGVIGGDFARSYFDTYMGKPILMRNNIVR